MTNGTARRCLLAMADQLDGLGLPTGSDQRTFGRLVATMCRRAADGERDPRALAEAACQAVFGGAASRAWYQRTVAHAHELVSLARRLERA